MKKICFFFLFFSSLTMLYAFPNITVKEYDIYSNTFDDLWEIKDNSFRRYVEYDFENDVDLYEQITIKDNDFYNTDNKKVGKWEKKGNIYIFSFFNDEYLSDYYEIDTKKNYLLKKEFFTNGILNFRGEYDKTSGKLLSSLQINNDGETLYTYEYWKITGNRKKRIETYSDGGKYIYEYDEDGKKLLKVISYNSDDSIAYESFYTYFPGTDIELTYTTKYSNGKKYEYEYSKSNGRTIRYTEINSTGTVVFEELYEYDEKDNKIKTLFYGKNKQFKSSEEYIYNDKNQKIAVITRNKENAVTEKKEYTYDSETDININFISYKKNAIEKIQEYDHITGRCLKEYDYSDETYYRIIREFNPDLQSWFGNIYIKKEIYETEENVIAFYYTFERNSEDKRVTRKNKYSSDDKLIEWYTYEYFGESDTERKINTYKNGKATDIKEYNENGYLISHSVLNEETGRVTKYSPVNFTNDGIYILNNRYSLSQKISSYSSVDYMYKNSKNEYSDWNSSYKAVVRKYEFTFNEGAYDLLNQLKTDKKIISSDGIILVDLYNDLTFFCFKIDENGFVDFDNCYMIELIKK